MSTLFFDHLVIREELEFELNSYTLTPEDREDLVAIMDNTLNSHILNVILNHLPKDKHTEFVDLFKSKPHDTGHLDYLKIHAHPEIEAEIKKQAARIKAEILSEIRKHRSLKSKK